jgi:ubiquinone/menaquinone biosynthesis C-methylase UbiE
MITAIDYSDDMLNKAREKFKGSTIQFIKMDAQDMSLRDNQFDVVVGSLVLSVVPDADRCLKEMLRVLKPNGEVIIFDKFAPKEKGLSPIKKAIRPFIKLLVLTLESTLKNCVTRIRIQLMSKKIRHYCLVGCIERSCWVKSMFKDPPGYFPSQVA